MNVLVELVKRDDGKFQLNHNGVENMINCHSCGVCKQMFYDDDNIGRCHRHGKISDRWVVDKRSYGCSDFESKDTDESYKFVYAYK